MSQSTPIQTTAHISAKHVQILAAALLGVSILAITAFAPLDVIHNATHDTRHSQGFPCH